MQQLKDLVLLSLMREILLSNAFKINLNTFMIFDLRTWFDLIYQFFKY